MYLGLSVSGGSSKLKGFIWDTFGNFFMHRDSHLYIFVKYNVSNIVLRTVRVNIKVQLMKLIIGGR